MILEKLVIPIGFDTGLLMAGIDLIGKSIGKFTDFLGDTVESASASEDAISQLNAVIESTGGIAGVTSEHAQELASSLQSVTKFSDEAILGGENMLLTFTSIGKDVFPQATETMLDMSQALGQDLKGSAIQLGKALNDPIDGITALRRVGVQFTDDQEAVIKSLVETGRLEEAQVLILEELSREFGGSAEAAGLTFAGGIARLNNKFDDMKEKIGMSIMPILSGLTDTLSGLMDNPRIIGAIDEFIAQIGKIGESVGLLVSDVVTAFETGDWSKVWGDLKNLIPDLDPVALTQAFEDWVASVDWNGVSSTFAQWINTVDWGGGTKAAIDSTVNILQALIDLIGRTNWSSLGQSIKNAITGVMRDGIGRAIGEAWEGAAIQFWIMVDNLVAGAKAKIGSVFSTSSVYVPAGQTAKKKAAGGMAGGLTWVGERGPELVNLPNGSNVNNAQTSANMGIDYYKLASILAVEFAKARD